MQIRCYADGRNHSLRENGARNPGGRGRHAHCYTVLRMDTVDTDLKLQLEALDAKLELVLRKCCDIADRDDTMRTAHSRLDQRFKNHEARLLSLERPRRR